MAAKTLESLTTAAKTGGRIDRETLHKVWPADKHVADACAIFQSDGYDTFDTCLLMDLLLQSTATIARRTIAGDITAKDLPFFSNRQISELLRYGAFTPSELLRYIATREALLAEARHAASEARQ